MNEEEFPRGRDPETNGIWTFYDTFRAFPMESARRRDKDVWAEIQMGLSAYGGGTHGEWGMRWYRFGRDDQSHPRLEAYGDSWAVLARSGLIELLAELRPEGSIEGPTPNRLMEALRERGWTDKTESYAAGDVCPTCYSHGFKGDVNIVSWRERIEAQAVTVP